MIIRLMWQFFHGLFCRLAIRKRLISQVDNQMFARSIFIACVDLFTAHDASDILRQIQKGTAQRYTIR